MKPGRNVFLHAVALITISTFTMGADAQRILTPQQERLFPPIQVKQVGSGPIIRGTIIQNGIIKGVLTPNVPLVVSPAQKIKIFTRRAIIYRPLTMRDPQTGQIVAPNRLIKLPNGRVMPAEAYYSKLNQYEKAFNQIGYSLREKGTFEIGETRINRALLVQQRNQQRLFAAGHPYTPPFSLREDVKNITLARRILVQRRQPLLIRSMVITTPRNAAVAQLPLIRVHPAGFTPIRLGPTAGLLRLSAPKLFRTLQKKAYFRPLAHDPPSNNSYPYNLDLGDPSTFGIYFHSHVEADGDSSGVTFGAAADSGGYLLGQKIDVVGLSATITSPLQQGGKGSIVLTGTLLGVTITPPSFDMSNASLQVANLIPASIGQQKVTFFQTTVQLGPVPLAIMVGGRLDLSAKLKLLLPNVAQIEATLDPRFKIGVWVEAGIGAAGIASVGVGGQLNFLDLQAPLAGSVALVPGTPANGGNNANDLGLYVDLNWTLKYDVLDGNLYLFAKFGPFEAKYKFFDWNGIQLADATLFNVSDWFDIGAPVPAWLANAVPPNAIASGSTPPQLTSIALSVEEPVSPFTSYQSGDTVAGVPLAVQGVPSDQNGSYFPCTLNYSSTMGSITPDPRMGGWNLFDPANGGGMAKLTASSPGSSVTGQCSLTVQPANAPFALSVSPDHGVYSGGTSTTVNGYALVPNAGNQQLLFGSAAAGQTFNSASLNALVTDPVSMTAVPPAVGIYNGKYPAPGFVDVAFSGQNDASGANPLLSYYQRIENVGANNSSVDNAYYYYIPDVPVALEAPLGALPAYPGASGSFFGNPTVETSIPIKLWDATGRPEKHKTISFHTTGGSFGQVINHQLDTTAITDNTGYAEVIISDNQAETDTVTIWNAAQPNGKITKLTLNIGMTPGKGQPPPKSKAPGGGTIVLSHGFGPLQLVDVAVQFVDQRGDPLINQTVKASADAGTITPAAQTDKNGIAHFFLTPARVGAANITVWNARQPSQNVTEQVQIR